MPADLSFVDPDPCLSSRPGRAFFFFHREAVERGAAEGSLFNYRVPSALPSSTSFISSISSPSRLIFPASESPTPSTSPANFADAIPRPPPSSKHSTDAPPASASNTQSQISASPRENPPPQDTNPLPHSATPQQRSSRCESPPANRQRRSPRLCSSPPLARAHSAAPEYFPANRI